MAGCGGAAPPTFYDGPKSYRIGGAVSGLGGATGLVLQNNATDDLAVTGDGDFAFVTAIAVGHDYDVTVLEQPSAPAQTCVIDHGTGLVGDGHVFDVSVRCVTNAYELGGTVSGSDGGTITLRNGSGDELTLVADGAFRFGSAVPSGAAYDVIVVSAPAGKSCSVAGGSGIMAAGPIQDVHVTCVDVTP